MQEKYKDKIVGILLAAGEGKRFGGDKCLAVLGNGIPMGLQSAFNLREAVDEVVCVIRPNDDDLKQCFANEGLDVLIADNASMGMSASIKSGILFTRDAKGWVIALADMPLIDTTTYHQVVSNLRKAQQPTITAPVIENRKGHPVGFSSHFKNELMMLEGDKGAGALLFSNKQYLNLFGVTDQGIHIDFDTAESLKTHNI